MSTLVKRFSGNLRFYRQQAKLSQGELAKKVDIGKSQISRWETGQQMPRPEMQETLARELGINPLDFYLSDASSATDGEPAGERLQRLRNGRPIKRLAPLAGLDELGWKRIEDGKAPLTPDVGRRLADALGVSVLEVMGPRVLPMSGDMADEFILVPHYDVEVSAGHGALNDHEPEIGSLAFRKDWVHRRGLDPGQLATVMVRGDSMEPELSDGDTVLVDRSQRQVLGDDLYVLRLSSALYVKRIQRLPGGRLQVTSLNPAYSTFEIDQGDPPEDVEVLGRVVWRGQEM